MTKRVSDRKLDGNIFGRYIVKGISFGERKAERKWDFYGYCFNGKNTLGEGSKLLLERFLLKHPSIDQVK